MTMEPLLPTIDWRIVFADGLTFEQWLPTGESPKNRRYMEEYRAKLQIRDDEREFLNALPRPVYVVAIAEDWCGDVARHVPVLQKLADTGANLHVRYITRAQHPGVFARFLTNGGEAIPKFIFLSDQFVECGHWGPMPADCKELIARGKACGDIPAARKKVVARYEADHLCRVVITELLHLIDIASCQQP
ncbi:MAG TPA: thioredoxin family protein [Candidatus Hydrogenedentes bacterium]|nr:thioredoxin family protein [Candidatus Hydrogenedentota bacterium]HPG70066.1 thioredoxin family protein [Candidatus Hydrogenedentota bacterium]